MSWLIRNVSGIDETPCTDAEQITGFQTILINTDFGISFRINESNYRKYKIGYDSFEWNTLNEYYQLMRKNNINTKAVKKMIESGLELEGMNDNEWTAEQVNCLFKNGIAKGVADRLDVEGKGDKFRNDPMIEMIMLIEKYESDLAFSGSEKEATDTEKFETLDLINQQNPDEQERSLAFRLVYQKYKSRVEREKRITLNDVSKAISSQKDRAADK